jgi:hypothetical protein
MWVPTQDTALRPAKFIGGGGVICVLHFVLLALKTIGLLYINIFQLWIIDNMQYSTLKIQSTGSLGVGIFWEPLGVHFDLKFLYSLVETTAYVKKGMDTRVLLTPLHPLESKVKVFSSNFWLETQVACNRAKFVEEVAQMTNFVFVEGSCV